ncbi:MAG: arsenate reductase family protein [Hasllibacter sp.]
MTTIWGLTVCDACRAARRAHPDAAFVDVRRDPPGRDVLERFRAAFGDALVNRRSATWRSLPEDERARDPLDLLADHPALMKRPVIEDPQGALTLGWRPRR